MEQTNTNNPASNIFFIFKEYKSKGRKRSFSNKKYKCIYSNCNKYYAHRNKMIAHVRTHLNIRPFQCDYCKKSFNEKGNLKTHLRIHTGERPYRCPLCSKSFKAFGQLKDHKSSHTGSKPFQCPICLKFYRRKGILKHHMLIHSSEGETIKGSFVCFFCFQNFENPEDLNKHFISHYSLTEKRDLSDEMITQASTPISSGIQKHNENKGILKEKLLFHEDMFKMLQKDICKNITQSNYENAINVFHLSDIAEVDKVYYDFNYCGLSNC